MTPEEIMPKIGDLAALPFFNSSALPVVAKQLSAFVDNDPKHLQWLINTAVGTWRKWEGVIELRALWCTRFMPRDGVEAYSMIPGHRPSDIELENSLPDNYPRFVPGPEDEPIGDFTKQIEAASSKLKLR